MGVGTEGAQGARAPPIILPSEIFLIQYALLTMKLVHKMLIFNKIFRLASLANQDNIKIYKIKRSNYFTSFIFKVPVLVKNIQKVCNYLFNTQSPSLIFKIIAYNFNTIQDNAVPKSQEKELSCRQSFLSKLVQNITILHIFHQNFSGGGPPPPSFHIVPIHKPA